jgi:hypothetical protein
VFCINLQCHMFDKYSGQNFNEKFFTSHVSRIKFEQCTNDLWVGELFEIGICILFHKSGNGFVPMSFCIVYDISVSLHVQFIVSRRIQLRSRIICFIYLLRWKCHFRWWRIKATDLKKFPNSQIVRALLELYPTYMWSEKRFIEILADTIQNDIGTKPFPDL